MAGGAPKGTSLTAIAGLAINLVTALVLVAVAWGAFRGSSEAQLVSLQKQVDRLESRVEHLIDRRER